MAVGERVLSSRGSGFGVFRLRGEVSLDDATAYLDNVEREVMQVAAKASENFANTCDLVESCGQDCSRQSCQPLQGDINLLTCKNVALNPTCSDANGNRGCSQLRVMLSKSFVRLAVTPDIADNYTICSQRMLDPLFLNISKVHNSAINLTSWFYLGSVEGVQRSFPGRDVLSSNCTFEPRKRPWYKGATAVQKDLVILLDGGNSMGDGLPVDILIKPLDFTKLTASVHMIEELLDTLNYGDRVSVVLFSSSSSATLVMTMISTGDSSDMQPLKTTLDAVMADTGPGTSNLLSALQKANATFLNPSDPAVLKIMVLITDGQFADATTVPALLPILTNLRSQKVLTLLYSFDRTDPPKAALSLVACKLNGTYERILKTVMNPLWTMRSYFGIIAYWRLRAMKFKPYWSKSYVDSNSLSEVITVAYPVFAPDNYTLVGVVGSDVLMTELGSIANTDFSSALSSRANDQHHPVTFVPLPCDVQLSTSNTCPSILAPVNYLCPSNDTSSISFADRVCDCSPQCKAPKGNSGVSAAVIGAATGGGALAVLVMLIFLVYCCKRRSRARKIENQGSGYASSIILSPKKEGSSKPASLSLKGMCLGQSSYDSEDVAVPTSTHTSSSSTRRQKSNKAPAWPTGSKSLSRDVVSFTMDELEDATQNWSEAALLGKGACGSVYRGRLLGVTRAIKKPHEGVEVANSTFDKELDLLSKLNHKCLVRLIGYCDNEHVLVFEYMANGTLEDCLHKLRLGRCLSWEERLRIAAGAAKGLEYLHEYATTMIIHGDVKPANILLDEKLEAHISDFGLSLSTADADASMVWASRMGGTPGYFDPEYASLGSLTPKSDVYSFGIVLLELFSGRKAVQEKQNISTWAMEKYNQGVPALLDPQLELPLNLDSFRTVIELALECVNKEHQFRPKMKDVSSVLSAAAADWHTVEHGGSPNGEWRPNRGQHPHQYQRRRRESNGPEEIEEDVQLYHSPMQHLL